MTISTAADSEKPARGLYFLANDHVVNWSIAFLESLRSHEPDLRIVMIPYNQRIDKMLKLGERYRFEVFDHPSFAALDEIGRSFFPIWEAWYRGFRKFSLFWGPLERFVYSDPDIVHLEGVEQYIDLLDQSGLDLLYSDEDMRQAYEQKGLQERMIARYGSRGFNAGFWITRRGLFTLDRIQQLAEEARPIAAQFNQGTYEQPFFNFCFDTARMRYKHLADLMPGRASTTMAGALRGVRLGTDGVYRVCDSASPEFNKRVTFIHWAGTPATPVMPHRSIFLHYLYMREPSWRRVWLAMKEAPRALVWRLIHFGRSAGLISRTYKRLMPKGLQRRVSARLHQK